MSPEVRNTAPMQKGEFHFGRLVSSSETLKLMMFPLNLLFENMGC